MDKDTFTMEDVEAMPASTEEPTEETTEATKTEESGSFLDSFKKAKGEAEGVTPEVVEEAKPEEDEATPESRSASDFKLIKAERDEAQQKMKEFEAKLKDLSNSDVDELLKEAEKERDTLSEQLRISSIERHPDFVKKYDTKVNQVVANAQATVGEHNAERIQQLLMSEDSDMRTDGIEQIFAELSPSKQAKLGAFLAQVDNIRAERSASLANHEESWKMLAANEEARRDSHLADSNALFDECLTEARNLEIYQSRDGEDDWNDEVAGRVHQARQIFCGDSNPAQMARASLWAAAGPTYRDLLIKQVELNRRLQAQLSGGDAANPTVSGGGEGSEGVEPKGFMEVFGEHSGMDVTN